MKNVVKMALLLALFFIIFFQISLHASGKMKIGVVEFEEKNNIGVENSGRIVAEWVVTELNRIGKFEVEERLMLKKVLEEQQLIMTGIIDETQAVKIGELYGIEALITGSVMKFADKISITGRIINVENGKVLKTASVSTEELSEVEKEVVILTNKLCDISRNQFEIRQDIEEKSQSRFSIGGGLGITSNNNDDFGIALESTMRYLTKDFTLWIDGAPVGGLKNIEFGGVIHVNRTLGLGLAYGQTYDNMIDYFKLTYMHFGMIARPRINLEMGLFIGGATGGVIWTENEVLDEKLDSYWTFPANYSVHVIFYPKENLGIMIKNLAVEIGDFADKIPSGYYWPIPDKEYRASKLHIGIFYRFPI